MSKNDDFKNGFEEGYRMVKGKNVALPAIPAMPATPANSTPFRVGLKKGIERAGGKIITNT